MSKGKLEYDSYSRCSLPEEKCLGEKFTLWLHDSCLFVCLFYFFLELNKDLLDDFIGVPKSSSHSIAISLNYSLFLTAHFQPVYSVSTHYVFHVLMELPCHCMCQTIFPGSSVITAQNNLLKFVNLLLPHSYLFLTIYLAKK